MSYYQNNRARYKNLSEEQKELKRQYSRDRYQKLMKTLYKR